MRITSENYDLGRLGPLTLAGGHSVYSLSEPTHRAALIVFVPEKVNPSVRFRSSDSSPGVPNSLFFGPVQFKALCAEPVAEYRRPRRAA